MNRLAAEQLRELPTFITHFMCDRSQTLKTFEQLVQIYDACRDSIVNDPSKDLRVERFVEDMRDGKWVGHIEITFQGDRVVDGVHRGIAYLKCFNLGIPVEHLPAVLLVSR